MEMMLHSHFLSHCVEAFRVMMLRYAFGLRGLRYFELEYLRGNICCTDSSWL